MPQTLLKTTECGSCLPTELARQARENEREHKSFIIRQSELKCEECWLQVIFSSKMSELQEERKQSEQAWQLPEDYSYFCITCKQVTNWRNSENGKYSKC